MRPGGALRQQQRGRLAREQEQGGALRQVQEWEQVRRPPVEQQAGESGQVRRQQAPGPEGPQVWERVLQPVARVRQVQPELGQD